MSLLELRTGFSPYLKAIFNVYSDIKDDFGGFKIHNFPL